MGSNGYEATGSNGCDESRYEEMGTKKWVRAMGSNGYEATGSNGYDEFRHEEMGTKE